MLFDLRGRGRRRTVQLIYIGLALLMGVGLVGFGIGGIGGGGILSSLSSNESSGSASFSSQIKKYKKLTVQQPNNVSAWEQLTLAQLHEAGGEAYSTQTGLTSKGKELFTQIGQSWSSYLALNPPKPSPELAQEMVRVYGEEGLNEPAEAVKVLQIVVAARPESASLYAALAEYAYKAHNTRTGDLASEKAVALAPSAQRPLLKKELAEIKKSPSGTGEKGAAASGETYTATVGGKTYHVKPSGHGTLTGTAAIRPPTPPATTPSKTSAPTTTAPGGGSSTTKK
jgi:hypothetical protein